MGFYFSQAYFPLPALLSGFQNYEQHFKKLKTKKMIKTLFQRVKTLKSGSGKWEMESLVARTDPALPALPTHPHRGGSRKARGPFASEAPPRIQSWFQSCSISLQDRPAAACSSPGQNAEKRASAPKGPGTQTGLTDSSRKENYKHLDFYVFFFLRKIFRADTSKLVCSAIQ